MATLGALADLLAACALVGELAVRRLAEQTARGQAAHRSPSKEDFHAACPAQLDTRPAHPRSPAALAEQLPETAIPTAITLLAGVIAKTAAPEGIEVDGDE